MLIKKQVFVGRFMSRKERLDILGDKAKKFTNVYIKNFADTMTEEKLIALFEPFGVIISAKVSFYFIYIYIYI